MVVEDVVVESKVSFFRTIPQFLASKYFVSRRTQQQ